SFKAEVAQGLHNFTRTTGNVFKLALYVATADLGADTTAYTSTGEASGTNYTAGGAILTNITPLSANGTGYWSFDDLTFSNVTLSCAGALIYNSTNANRAVCVLSFGSTITKTASNLIITFPPMGATDSILRIT
ncbi:MAG: hypothetical protein EBR82_82235, partial [Caulobacteraceae bacterium]|nr:hypothetical protein [Caulobacteraceae bacterium]